jgi:serine/threonine protein kinase
MGRVEVTTGGGCVLHVPTTIERYDYVRVLGTGTSSAVILVQCRSTERLFACKVVSRALLVESQQFGRVEQEVRLLPSLHHPNIVHFEEVLFDPDFIFVIMEYCVHGDLFTHIRTNGLLQEGRARDVFRQIAEAVRYIHGRDIAHRDLKLANILLDHEWNIRLADFGLCHPDCSRRLLSTPCGSLFDAAPEVMANRDYDGKMADIWSLGICLYTIVTGTLPWRNCPDEELLDEIQTTEIEIPLCLSPRLQQLLAQMLQREPEKRATIDEVLNATWVTTHVKETRTATSIKAPSFQVGILKLSDSAPSSRCWAPKRILARPRDICARGVTAPKPIITLMRQVPNPSRPRVYVGTQKSYRRIRIDVDKPP